MIPFRISTVEILPEIRPPPPPTILSKNNPSFATGDLCCICMENSICCETICGPFFCNCVLQYFKRRNDCPVCRSDVSCLFFPPNLFKQLKKIEKRTAPLFASMYMVRGSGILRHPTYTQRPLVNDVVCNFWQLWMRFPKIAAIAPMKIAQIVHKQIPVMIPQPLNKRRVID